MKTAIVYDRVNKFGGAEKVLLALHDIFPDAPLYTALYSRSRAKWADVFPKIHASWLNKIKFIQNHHELLSIFMPLAFESFNFDNYDLVVSVTSEAAKGIITKPETYHICYCLTPTRYLYSGFSEYESNPPGILASIPFYKNISKPFVKYIRNWDQIASKRPDLIVAISSEVKKRIKKYYNDYAKIIFPPVNINEFKGSSKYEKKLDLPEDYYLIVSRLEPYKKVELAVQTFNELGKPLVVVGIGSSEARLKRIAKKNIKFSGFVDETDLPKYYRNAKALIFPQDEDFGITAVEAQAAGCPIIAFRSGGALDTVIDGKTGVFFLNQTTQSLKKAIWKFEYMKIDKRFLFKNSERFSKKKFEKQFLDLVNKTV